MKDHSPRKEHRILLLQNSSIFESFGGIEYYNDDLLTLACEIYSSVNVTTIIPQRQAISEMPTRPYFASFVKFWNYRWISKLENRLPLHFLLRAHKIIRQSRPTLLIANHVYLAPVALLLSKIHKIPYLVIGYGIEIWGRQLPHDELALKQSNGILAISNWTRQILVERGFSPEKVKVVHPRLATNYEKIQKPRHSSIHSPFTLLTVSRLDGEEKYKGQDHVMQALHKLLKIEPSVKIRYIIQGEGTDRPRLQALARSLNLDKIVEFRNRVAERSEFEGVYREADLFVMPSRFGFWDKKWHGEGFGIVYLEAAAFGVPSVAYKCGGATDIISNGVNGMLVKPDDITELANTIFLLYSKPELVLEMGAKAYEIVMKRFTRKPIARELSDALDAF